MSHIVTCTKLKKEAEGLARPPSGELGQRDEQISEAWQQWLQPSNHAHQRIPLKYVSHKARDFCVEMEKFLFGDGSAKPGGYMPPEYKLRITFS